MRHFLPITLCLLLAGGCEPSEEQRAREAEQRANAERQTWQLIACSSIGLIVVALIGGIMMGASPRKPKGQS